MGHFFFPSGWQPWLLLLSFPPLFVRAHQVVQRPPSLSPSLSKLYFPLSAPSASYYAKESNPSEGNPFCLLFSDSPGREMKVTTPNSKEKREKKKKNLGQSYATPAGGANQTALGKILRLLSRHFVVTLEIKQAQRI